MNIVVNKKTTTRPVKYAALCSGTISHVWYDDETAPAAKRTNRITLTREKKEAKIANVAKAAYDA